LWLPRLGKMWGLVYGWLRNWFYLVLPEVRHLADVGARLWNAWDR